MPVTPFALNSRNLYVVNVLKWFMVCTNFVILIDNYFSFNVKNKYYSYNTDFVGHKRPASSIEAQCISTIGNAKPTHVPTTIYYLLYLLQLNKWNILKYSKILYLSLMNFYK